MIRLAQSFRRVCNAVPTMKFAHPSFCSTIAANTSEASSTSPDIPLKPSQPSVIVHPTAEGGQLTSWGGADVKVVMHESFESMVPTDVISIPGVIFNSPVRTDLIHRTVVWQLAKRRAGTHKAKNRSEVAGSGRKYRPQKGTGRSRQGARTSPIFRGGGRAHGPVPRDYSYPLPANVRRNALRSMLSSKRLNGQLWIVESAGIADGKTKSVIDCMEKYAWNSALIIDDIPEGTAGVEDSLYQASHNVEKTLAMNALGLNVYDALSFNNLVLTRAALEHLTKRFAKYDWLF